MSLINKIDAIIKNKVDVDEVGFLKEPMDYDQNLSLVDVDVKTLLPKPPKNSSATTIKELKAISEVTQKIGDKELDLIHIVDQDPIHLFTRFLEARSLKFPLGDFYDYYNIVEHYSYALKYYFNRARPEQVAPYHNIDINILYTDTHHTPAYPSGHSMYSELAAYLLTDMYPQYKKEFFELSKYCGFARIIQGVHYQSDIEASEKAMRVLYPKIKERVEDERAKKNPFDITGKA